MGKDETNIERHRRFASKSPTYRILYSEKTFPLWVTAVTNDREKAIRNNKARKLEPTW